MTDDRIENDFKPKKKKRAGYAPALIRSPPLYHAFGSSVNRREGRSELAMQPMERRVILVITR
jgi:hypothetical protein